MMTGMIQFEIQNNHQASEKLSETKKDGSGEKQPFILKLLNGLYTHS